MKERKAKQEWSFWQFVNTRVLEEKDIQELIGPLARSLPGGIESATNSITTIHKLARSMLADLVEGNIWYHHLATLNEYLKQMPVVLTPRTDPVGADQRGDIHAAVYKVKGIAEMRKGLIDPNAEVGTEGETTTSTPHITAEVVLTLSRLIRDNATVKQCAAARCDRYFEDHTKAGVSLYCGEACRKWAYRQRQSNASEGK